MGAGQIGGIATLLDIDLKNAAGFEGEIADARDAPFIVYFLSHTILFCVGTLLEVDVVLTPARCVYGERNRFSVFAGTHLFLSGTGAAGDAISYCYYKGFNKTSCCDDNIALLILEEPFNTRKKYSKAEFAINKVRYGVRDVSSKSYPICETFGWGSRRSGYLIPLMIRLYKMELQVQSTRECDDIWNNKHNYLCLSEPTCKDNQFGALCPDDMGSALICPGNVIRGMMVSRLMDRPCGVGYLDLNNYEKFITCGIADARDIKEYSDSKYDISITAKPPDVRVQETTLNGEVIVENA